MGERVRRETEMGIRYEEKREKAGRENGNLAGQRESISETSQRPGMREAPYTFVADVQSSLQLGFLTIGAKAISDSVVCFWISFS